MICVQEISGILECAKDIQRHACTICLDHICSPYNLAFGSTGHWIRVHAGESSRCFSGFVDSRLAWCDSEIPHSSCGDINHLSRLQTPLMQSWQTPTVAAMDCYLPCASISASAKCSLPREHAVPLTLKSVMLCAGDICLQLPKHFNFTSLPQRRQNIVHAPRFPESVQAPWSQNPISGVRSCPH